MKINKRYLPNYLSSKDKRKQLKELLKSRKMYKHGKYYTRQKMHSFQSKKSSHIRTAKKLYNINSIVPSTTLAKSTGCSLKSLQKIVNKGEGAYFSSGSRPNQSAKSWGLARLASSITGGKSSAVDFSILEQGCRPQSKALILAKKARKKHGNGTRKSPKTHVYFGGETNIFSSNNFQDIILKIKEITIDNNIEHELCGTVAINRTNNDMPKYSINLHNIETDTSRLSCNFEKYSEVIWHSHPAIAKYYPSVEDILKSIKIKNDEIKSSFIFTSFGYWQLDTIQHFVDENNINEIKNNINEILTTFYHSSNRGRKYNINSVAILMQELNTLLQGYLEIGFNLY